MANTKTNTLLPAYLVVGEDYLKRDRVVKKMHIRLEKLGDLSFNSDTFNGTTDDGEQIINACKTLPFASEKRLVTVKDAQKLSKSSQTQIVDYLKDPLDSTILLLITDKLPKNNAIYKAVAALSAQAVIDCTPPTKKELPHMIRDMGPAHGITLTQDAAMELLKLVGEDTVRIDAELEKLSLSHTSNKPIEASDVRDMVSRAVEAKPWELADAFGRHDLKQCLNIISLMPTASPFALLYQCVGRLRDAMHAQHVAKTSSNVSSALAAELKMPEFRVRSFVEAGRKWRADQLRFALEASLDTERKMKSSADPDAAFKDWIVSALTE